MRARNLEVEGNVPQEEYPLRLGSCALLVCVPLVDVGLADTELGAVADPCVVALPVMLLSPPNEVGGAWDA